MTEAERRVTEAVRAGCNAADIHLRCSYPECGCKQTPIIVRAALAIADTGEGWRPIEDAPKDGTPVLLVRRTQSGPAYLVARNPHLNWDAAWWTGWSPLPSPQQQEKADAG